MAQRSRNPRNRRLSRPRASTALARFFLSTHPGSGYPPAAADRRNWSQVSPCAGRLPSDRGPNADRPFDGPATSTARRVAAATWMMSSTTVASRAYAVVPARRSRGSRGGASRPGSAPAAGSARHRADASRRDRARAQPRPTTCIVPEAVRRGFRARGGSEHSTPLVPLPSAGPAASFGLRWSRCPCRSLRTNSWPRRCSSRSSSLSLICRASLDERKALASAKTASAAAHGARLGGSMHGTPVRGTSNVRPWNPVVTAIAGLPPFPRHRTRTPRECPEGSAPVGEKTEGVRRRDEARLAAEKTPVRAGLLDVPPEMATGETHPRAKEPMNRAKNPL